MCECKELIDKGVCHKGFIWNPSNCECEYDKSCDIVEYLNYSNRNCRIKLFGRLVEECMKRIDKVEINQAENKSSPCTLYIVLFSIIFTISILIGICFVYSYLYLKYDDARVMLNTRTGIKIY